MTQYPMRRFGVFLTQLEILHVILIIQIDNLRLQDDIQYILVRNANKMHINHSRFKFSALD